MSKKGLNNFYEALGFSESGGNYSSVNKFGYLGKYQMGEAALIDSGYYKKKSPYNNDWSGTWSGKNGVSSKDDFLKSPKAQEEAQMDFKKAQWLQIKSLGLDKYVGKMINGVEITPSGILGAAHLKGPGGVKKYLESNGKNNPKDGFGTSVENYMKKFSGYDLTPITGRCLKSNQIPSANPDKGTTGFAAPVNAQQFTREDIAKMDQRTFDQKLPAIEKQMRETGISLNSAKDFTGYQNSELNGTGRIFTREEINKMSTDEYNRNEKAIFQQQKELGIPSEKDLKNSGGTVYVEGYTRSDGTQVKGFYRSVPSR